MKFDQQRAVARLVGLLGSHRRILVMILDLAAFVAAGLGAFLLRFDLSVPRYYLPHLRLALVVWGGVKVATFLALGLDRISWRRISAEDTVRLGMGNLAAAVTSAAIILALGPGGFPRSIYLLDLVLSVLLTAALRLAVRLLAAFGQPSGPRPGGRRTVIYGAGEAGVALLREIRQNRDLPYEIVGFVDDDAGKHGLSILGVKVLGGGDSLNSLKTKYALDTVLVAIPSATGEQMARILEHCHRAGVAFRTIPGLGELIENGSLARQIREVSVEDLLGRNPVRLDETAIRGHLEGRVVLVTGAAGSIGSELCRQIARFHPEAIVGLEIAETPLFDLERRMRQAFPNVAFHPEIGSIQNQARLREIFLRYRPQVVYHAAAYKHVPVMETHVFEAVENNVFGTYNVAAIGAAYGVEKFVLISTDKAVRPTSVMGVSKRIAELVALSFQDSGARYVAVRFGNVLGSAGSVVPLFREQIAAGGPVTVTHPEMRRYFMTIPEAVQLVLQAAAMGKGGEIFLLDMGQPVKIVDLARKMILLSGLKPDEDIKIVFTGPRPGEKLYEELSTFEEETVPTFHEKIRIFASDGLPRARVDDLLDQLRCICEARDLARLVLLFKEVVPDYNPSRYVLERMLPAARAAAAGV